MQIELTSVLTFTLGLLYLIMLPGFLIVAGLKIRDLGVIGTLATSFGVGVGVLTLISIALSLTGSLGLTTLNIVSANAIVLITLCLAFYVLRKQNHRRNEVKS